MDFIRRLPKEIISHIIPYTYRHPSKQLLRDIVHYKETKEMMLDLYHTFWRRYDIGSQEYKHWLVNDILDYANHGKATMHGYVNHFHTMIQRNHKISLKRYLKELRKRDVKTQINLLLGLFNIHERQDFWNHCLVS